MITSMEEFEKVAGNPDITERDGAAVRGADLVSTVMSQAGSSGDIRYKDRLLESISISGVSRDYAEFGGYKVEKLSLIHISEPTRLGMISYAVFCLKKKKK